MTRSAVLTCFPSFAFFTPHSPWLLLFLSLSAFVSPIYSSLFQLFHTCPLHFCYSVLHPACLSPICINPYSFLLFFLSHLLPLLSSSQRWVGSRDRDDFISWGTELCRVISLQDRRDNSSGLVMHTATEYVGINQHTYTPHKQKWQEKYIYFLGYVIMVILLSCPEILVSPALTHDLCSRRIMSAETISLSPSSPLSLGLLSSVFSAVS